MATKLTKKVTRISLNDEIRDRSKRRPLIVTIYPGTPETGGYIGLRMQGTRQQEIMLLDDVYHKAIRGRVFREKMEKAKARKAKKRKGK